MKDEIADLLPIKSLSYWRYTRLKRCLLSGAYPSSVVSSTRIHSGKGRPQVVGSIFHSVMEQHNKQAFGSRTGNRELRTVFNKVVADAAKQIREDPRNRHLGNPLLWPELTEIYKSVRNLVERGPLEREMIAHAEETLSSKDTLLSGQIDAYFVGSNGIDLVDYKSGIINDGELPKEDYVNQLYFYAYLINENYGMYPSSLRLIGKDFEEVRIEGNPQLSLGIADDMRSILGLFNSRVKERGAIEKLTSPSSENCLFCEAKPVCGAFWDTLPNLEFPQWAHVVLGTQSGPMEKKKAGGTNFEMAVEKGSMESTRIRITKMFEERFPELHDAIGQRLIITNLRMVSHAEPTVVEVTDRSSIIQLRV